MDGSAWNGGALISLKELAQRHDLRLKRGHKTLWHWVKRGVKVEVDGRRKTLKLRASKISRQYYVTLDDVREFMRALCPAKPIGESA